MSRIQGPYGSTIERVDIHYIVSVFAGSQICRCPDSLIPKLRPQRMVRDTMDDEGHSGWLRTQRMVKDTTDVQGYNGPGSKA